MLRRVASLERNDIAIVLLLDDGAAVRAAMERSGREIVA